MYELNDLLSVMSEAKASDMYLSIMTYPVLKINGSCSSLEKELLTSENLKSLLQEMLSEDQIVQFIQKKEFDFTISRRNLGRFRVNAFIQRGSVSFVFRRITSKIMSLDELNLPPILKELVKEKRGIILVVGSTGSGKSTTLAAMVHQRNISSAGHILTIEDPVEYLHSHQKSIVNQREIGMDTDSYHSALRSALRQAPDLLLIGEIRDEETMSAALNFAETGHLVLSTLHSNNAYQTLERIMSFYPPESHHMVQLQVSLNLKAVIAQRLIPSIEGGRVAAMELMLASSRVKDLIHRGDIEVLRSAIEASSHEGMQTFDQALHKLFESGQITFEDAVRFADRPNDLKLKIQSEQASHQSSSDIRLQE
ncbi:MAG TPA: PilT/PilU family type 4a pilus ATPase [Candidatus Marinimicrobia bacterium]|nr:PilT/PilU family type 4a pilus ATPase [Candidatus Neomarinimicrobiota bacterium]